MSKFCIYGIVLQLSIYSFVLATDVGAQYKSVNEIKLDLSMKSPTNLKKVLNEIEKSTGFQFSFIDQELISSSNYSLNLPSNEYNLGDLLRNISEQSGLTFKRVNDNIYIRKRQYEDNVSITEVMTKSEITGQIVDENGEPLPGATIVVTGTSIGTTSDFEGNFTLNVPENASSMTVSFVGYQSQEVQIGAKTEFSIKMKLDAEQLEELIVVGYGSQRKSDVTGALSTVSGEDISVAPTPNLSAGLAGKLTGVLTSQQTGLPGFDNPIIRIRGASSLNSNDALVIVDGIERPLNRINPNEIESITVLKDAASAAIYGARAANGVILVTTKRGGDKKTRFNYSGSFGVQRVTRVPELMDALEYATYFNEAQLNTNPGLDPAEIRFSDQEIQDIRNGVAPNTDWMDVLLDDAPIQQHNFSVNGGKDNVGYFFSFGVVDQDGMYETSGFKSYSLRSNVDTKIGENLSLGIDLAGRIEDTRNSAFGGINDNVNSGGFATADIMSALGNANPTFPAFVDGDGDGVADEFGYDGRIETPIGRAIGSGQYKRLNNLLQSSVTARYDLPFVEGLFVKGRYSYDISHRVTRAFKTPFVYYTPGDPDFVENESIPTPRLNELRRSTLQQTLQLSVGYDKTFGKNDISALFLYEQVEGDFSEIEAFRDGFLGASLDQFIAGSSENASNDGFARSNARVGYVGRINYGRSDKYLFQANFRYDGSYRFAEGSQFGFFPAVSAAWRISEEGFFSEVGPINSLKLRGSWGVFGNDRVGPFQWQSAFSIEPSASAVGGTTRTGISEATLPNQMITWETATGTDVGVEMGLFQNKIEVEFDYFWKKTEDILIPSGAVPDHVGALLPDQGLGETKNRGLEVLVKYSENFNDLSVKVSGNVTYATSEVIRDGEPEVAPEVSYYSTLGQPIDVERGYVALGLFQSREELNGAPRQDQDVDNPNSSLFPGDIRYKDINGDGVIDGADRTVIGKSGIPELVFGLNLNLGYKGFGLIANFQGASGFTRYAQYTPFSIEGNSRAALADSWRPGNEDAEFPRLTVGTTSNNDLRSTFWLKDITYLRLRNIEFSYTFSNNLTSKVGVNDLKIFVAGNNLATWANVDDIDPEGPSTFRPYLPQMKTFLLGVNLSF
ncbi:MAG: TonB-dependent receptor [Cyclobacteriaceae bacterium]